METIIQAAAALRAILHGIPEKSMHEVKTKATLMQWLSEHTDLELHDCGCWFYAAWRYAPDAPSIALRADFDAVTDGDGISRHLCGHDGHSAVLAALGMWISREKPAKNIFLLFQPGEESGEGAAVARELFQLERVDKIYGLHNIPGEPLGQILVKNGTFNCASTGLEIRLRGATTHAAYPEFGRNPAQAFARLMLAVSEYADAYRGGILFSTVIGLELGSRSYGISASEGTLRLTVRAEHNQAFQEVLAWIREKTAQLAEEYGLTWEITEYERFPATVNHAPCVDDLRRAAESLRELTAPFRWSEDFGWYLLEVPGAFFGIGAGTECPQIHTETYEYPDALIPHALKVFRALCVQGIRQQASGIR